MVVVTLTDCPPRLRGDLSKWLMEVNTGTYVGQLNRRVREELWKRICNNLPKGRATMVYSANNEQRMEFRVHNTTWQPVDFDGLTLMRRPVTAPADYAAKQAPSKAAAGQLAGRSRTARAMKEKQAGYVVIDVETTGLNPENDEIIELGAIRVIDHESAGTFSALVRPKGEIPAAITAMTGITAEAAEAEGGEPGPSIERFWGFVGNGPMVGHNISFDCAFLRKASERAQIQMPRVRCVDTLVLAKRCLRDVTDHKLGTVASYFGLEAQTAHRALTDCITTFRIYEKLNEI